MLDWRYRKCRDFLQNNDEDAKSASSRNQKTSVKVRRLKIK